MIEPGFYYCYGYRCIAFPFDYDNLPKMIAQSHLLVPDDPIHGFVRRAGKLYAVIRVKVGPLQNGTWERVPPCLSCVAIHWTDGVADGWRFKPEHDLRTEPPNDDGSWV